MITVRDLTKRFGSTHAVEGLSFDVLPGRVTGFLGPNGAGKSTTMRLILGLDRPGGGTALIKGAHYRDLSRPMRTVGAMLESRAAHPGRTARNHLLFLAQTQGLTRRRVDEVLDIVGLTTAADKRVGAFSLGMAQRLGLAAAMLGDPEILLLDEPVNGLDPEGVLWIRTLMKSLASEGRTIFVSSHLMNEMAVTADHLIVIHRGRLLADCGAKEFIVSASQDHVRVVSPDTPRLAALIEAAGGSVMPAERGESALLVTGVTAPRIGELAASESIVLHELSPQGGNLEKAFLDLIATREAR